MNTLEHAKLELKLIGMLDSGDEMNEAMCKDVLQLLEVFGTQGHSGFSAPYAINLFEKLANHKPLGPLTGADEEWSDISHYGSEDGKMKWQNKRASHVFKDSDGSTYDVNAIVFEEPDGSRYTSKGSSQPVTFPYVPKQRTVFVDAEGNHLDKALGE